MNPDLLIPAQRAPLATGAVPLYRRRMIIAGGAGSGAGVGFTFDDLESYSDAAALNGLNRGEKWLSGYVDEPGDVGVQSIDDVENYTDAADLDGLNSGNSFNGAYNDAQSWINNVDSQDDEESYTDAADLDGLNGGVSWGGVYHDA